MSRPFPTPTLFSSTVLDRLIEEVTVDAFTHDEKVSAFHCVLEERVTMPFSTSILGVDVDVVGLEVDTADRLLALCSRGGARLRIPLQDLPIPTPAPPGAEFVAAWCRWHEAEGGG